MASKSKRRRRVLGASCILAALIIAGSSFAWFTSKDEVTNRLSASSEYGVAVAENFQPPENWVPGQTIGKDAAATNTGNVDAFVRMYLDGKMRLLQQYRGGASNNTANAQAKYGTVSAPFTAPTVAVTDSNLLNLGMTMMDANGNYYKTLETSQTLNPNASINTNNPGYADAFSGPYSEVQAMQSGVLAYAPDDAEYTYVLNEETELKIYLTSTVGDAETTNYKYVKVPKGTLVHVGATSPTAATLSSTNLNITATETVTSTSGANNDTAFKVVYVEKQTHNDSTTYFTPVNVEYESFTPMTDGLYLFLRNETSTDQANPEFSGYYMNGYDNTNKYTNAKFYALNTDTLRANQSNYTVKGLKSTETAAYGTPITVTYDDDTNSKNIKYIVPNVNLELYTAQYANVDSTNLKWYYDSTGSRIIALYDKDNDNAFDDTDEVAVIIKLDNVGTDSAEKWTAINGTAVSTTVSGMKENGTGADISSAVLLSDNAATASYDVLKFYYNNDLESGDTTTKLVDNVKLYEGVKNTAYLAFDFDLNVHLDSVQVTYDEAGKESALAVAQANATWTEAVDGGTAAANGTVGAATWKGTTTDGGAAVSAVDITGNEISKVTWSKTTT